MYIFMADEIGDEEFEGGGWTGWQDERARIIVTVERSIG